MFSLSSFGISEEHGLSEGKISLLSLVSEAEKIEKRDFLLFLGIADLEQSSFLLPNENRMNKLWQPIGKEREMASKRPQFCIDMVDYF